MAGSRKSTPSRARSSSVTSNASAASGKPAKSADSAVSSSPPKSPKKASTKASKTATAATSSAATPKSPASKAASKTTSAPATPRKSTGTAKSTAVKKELTAEQRAAIEARPTLPKERNPRLPDEDVPVKVQVIERDEANIVIGRVKLPVLQRPQYMGLEDRKEPDHRFLLKRFDTNAVSADTMFRIAFPTSSDEAEALEMQFLEKRYDSVSANGGLERVYKRPRGRPSKKFLETGEMPFEERLPTGSTGVRLQGTWIPSVDALDLAKEYGLERYARPLIEARAGQSPAGGLMLTPSKTDKISTPISGSSKKSLKKALSEITSDGSPLSPRATKRARENGSSVTAAIASAVPALTQEQIEQQIKEAKALGQSIRENVTPTATPTRKRRAANQSPSASNDPLADDDEYVHSNAVVRSIRRGSRAARRRPVVTTAGALGAVGAVGAGALAWLAGGNLDVAQQLVQQGVQNLGSYFF